jgi:cysteine desulfurase/selenocysteine lyase
MTQMSQIQNKDVNVLEDIEPALAAKLRSAMPVARRWAYFDHAAVGAISEPARQAIVEWAEQAASEGDTVWPTWARRVEEIRAVAARMIGAASEEIALVKNTTDGISIVAEGFPWQAGDNVVTLANEFPSNQYPWMNLASRGVETRRVEVDTPGEDGVIGRVNLDRLATACDRRTRMIAVSWVGYASGYRLDLDAVARLARDVGARLFVDAIQGLGVFPVDVARTPIDYLAADGHKWLLGPEGAGILYVRRERLDELRAIGVGWHSVAQGSDFTNISLTLKPSAQRFEGGSQNMPGMLALGASLELFASLTAEFGRDAIARRVVAVADAACECLRDAGAQVVSDRTPEHASGIVSFAVPGQDAEILRRKAAEAGIALSCRAGRLRISPHAYNDAADIERLHTLLKSTPGA